MEEFHALSTVDDDQAGTSGGQAVDPCSHVVHILMCYQVGGGDPDFVRKAIESLVKKLKDRREQLDSLISAITSGGKQPTSCVTIPRSLDGRLQVAGRKGLPHVVYARIWRWPNVNKTELLKIPICHTQADHPDLICINPFHYDRVVSSGLSILDMTSLRMEPLSNPTEHLPVPPHNFLPADANLSNGFGFPSSFPSMAHAPPIDQFIPDKVRHTQQHFIPSTVQQPRLVTHYPPNQWNSIPPELHQLQPQQLGVPTLEQQQQSRSDPYNLGLVHLPPVQNPPEHWCSINYFELDTQLGERFKVPWTIDEVIVDGGMDPSGAMANRFCLGALPNVHRSEASERARLHIGKGVKLKCASDGSVYLECLSQKGVFVKSYYLDYEFGLQYGSTVNKVCSGAVRKVFDLRWAYVEMHRQLESAQIAAVAQAYAVAGIAPQLTPSSLNEHAPLPATTGMDELRMMCCSIALSFVKGWGTGYTRLDIKETPCWIEIQLHRPLQLLSELLKRAE